MTSEPGSLHVGLADRHQVLAVGDFAFVRVKHLVLDEDHRVVRADGAFEQALGVAGRGGQHDGEAGYLRVPGFQPVRVRGRQAAGHPRAAAEDDGNGELAAAHVAHVGGVVHDLVDRHQAEAERHEFDDRPQAGHGRADADAGKSFLGNRRVDDSPIAEPLEHALADLVGAVVFRDFLTHQEDVLVALHLFAHRLIQRFAERKHRHGHSCGM